MLLSSHSSATLGCTGVDRGPGSLQRLLRLPRYCKWLCPHMPQPLSFSCFIPAWSSEEEKTGWTELSQEQSKPSRSSWADYLLFLFTNDNMNFSVSHLKKNQNWEQNNMGLPWLSEWLSMCSLPAPRWRKAQSLSFVDGVLLSERLNSTSCLSKTQFTVFHICLL